MIANWSYEKSGMKYSVIDADTKELLDKEGIRFADDANGLYYRSRRNEHGNRFMVQDPVTGEFDVATDLVRRNIRIVPRITDSDACP